MIVVWIEFYRIPINDIQDVRNELATDMSTGFAAAVSTGLAADISTGLAADVSTGLTGRAGMKNVNLFSS